MPGSYNGGSLPLLQGPRLSREELEMWEANVVLKFADDTKLR